MTRTPRACERNARRRAVTGPSAAESMAHAARTPSRVRASTPHTSLRYRCMPTMAAQPSWHAPPSSNLYTASRGTKKWLGPSRRCISSRRRNIDPMCGPITLYSENT
eukprot:Amastigsp_a7954_14.p5 type:complete len:107 gc:universal Amastigsp_a7954_14:1000-680(-)